MHLIDDGFCVTRRCSVSRAARTCADNASTLLYPPQVAATQKTPDTKPMSLRSCFCLNYTVSNVVSKSHVFVMCNNNVGGNRALCYVLVTSLCVGTFFSAAVVDAYCNSYVRTHDGG